MCADTRMLAQDGLVPVDHIEGGCYLRLADRQLVRPGDRARRPQPAGELPAAPQRLADPENPDTVTVAGIVAHIHIGNR